MRERLKDKRQRWKAEQGHRQNRHWADRAIWSQPDGGGQTWHIADKVSNLPDVNGPALGYTTDDDKQWTRVENEWKEVPSGDTALWHIAQTKNDLPGVPAPALGYTTNDHKQWTRVGSEWLEVPRPKQMITVRHGTNSNKERPSDWPTVFWIGMAEPNNGVGGDIWLRAVDTL